MRRVLACGWKGASLETRQVQALIQPMGRRMERIQPGDGLGSWFKMEEWKSDSSETQFNPITLASGTEVSLRVSMHRATHDFLCHIHRISSLLWLFASFKDQFSRLIGKHVRIWFKYTMTFVVYLSFISCPSPTKNFEHTCIFHQLLFNDLFNVF